MVGTVVVWRVQAVEESRLAMVVGDNEPAVEGSVPVAAGVGNIPVVVVS